MAYLHCHNCGWDNGDFGYGFGYQIKETLRRLWPFEYRNQPQRTNTECWWPITIPTNKRNRWGDKQYIHIKKLIWISDENKTHFGSRIHIPFINSLKVAAYYLVNQKYRTINDFKRRNPDNICPKCGKQELDID